ncbi:MAG TPA: PAC2 family protein [Nitrososphaeraceae archaeon]
MAVDHLIHELKAIQFADIFCTSLPPSVVISPEGIVDLNRNSIYYSHSDNHKKDFVFVTGNSQPVSPESEYLLAEEILKIVKKFGSHEIVTLGANITGSFSKEPNVYFAVTCRETLESLTIKDVVKLVDGTVTGTNGLILGIAKLFDMQGICLLGETSGYVIDALAA